MKNKTVIITGSTRGIGLAIARKLAMSGANIVITGKTTEAHPKLEGTLQSALEEIQRTGASAIALKMDIREEADVSMVVEETIKTFGGIDILVNNASAIQLTPTLQTDMKKFDLMHQVNMRGTFMMSKYCLPHLLQSPYAHILTLSPPLNIQDHWFGSFLPYTLAKYGMSLVTRGLANEYKDAPISINALWPVTTIATAAVRNLLGGEEMCQMSRTPEIMADAAWHLLHTQPGNVTGMFFTDEEVLKNSGINDFSGYAVNPEKDLQKDIFLD